jgi:cation diffusion facilitator family transporter
MVVEIAAGLLYGSMALLADGLHMASHAVALGIAAFAYRYARLHAADPRFSFGTGKVGTLAGYSGAVLLGVFAVGMAFESIERLLNPVQIAVDQALLVAVLGLIVNGLSVFILGWKASDSSAHVHFDQIEPEHHHHRDHNLRAAYFHVLADALTSVLAIAALVAAKFAHAVWLDPVIGILGAALVARWSVGLLKQSAGILLDHQANEQILGKVRTAIEQHPETKVVDLHLWSIGIGKRAAIIALETPSSLGLDEYRGLLPQNLGIEHLTIEIWTKSK